MKCPVCKDESLVMADRQGIEIDYCPSCRGVWLDRGELDKIIERTVPQQPVQQPPQSEQVRSQGYGSGYGHKKYKKKSLLGELFDF
ncbi:zf-TFIIB domain-containing protein [Pseudidiomarina insulisalsae]|uniref:Transcription factor zinc-finger domain-containing protein n=1 Tax=Pseudidiomarina insulisalsae TaxID=575789 RepID=A0A432YPT2_9GAMM|nr:zf-TFIIB domain-containing protein [Pseudidiomarina insulisalsae]RUO63126.1 hypothetical protein CWI71_02575 [Pseudidiomarina insulisalsae]